MRQVLAAPLNASSGTQSQQALSLDSLSSGPDGMNPIDALLYVDVLIAAKGTHMLFSVPITVLYEWSIPKLEQLTE